MLKHTVMLPAGFVSWVLKENISESENQILSSREKQGTNQNSSVNHLHLGLINIKVTDEFSVFVFFIVKYYRE